MNTTRISRRKRVPSRAGQLAVDGPVVTLKRYGLALLLALGAWAVAAGAANAQQPTIRVSTSNGPPLVVNGVQVTRLPVEVGPGAQVCVARPLVTLGDQERSIFKIWSDGTEDECLTPTEPGEYVARFEHQVLLQILSQFKAYRDSVWVPRGKPTRLEVLSLVVESPGVRYQFEEWTFGENRFNPDNVITPSRPFSVEVKWTKEYFLDLVGPEGAELVGEGWHSAGSTVVLKTDATAFAQGKDARLQFSSWEITSNAAIIIPNPQRPLTSIRMGDTHTIEAVYTKAYKVVVTNPARTVHDDWVPEGEQLPVQTEETIVIAADQERLSFKGWEGAAVETAKGFVVVDGPITLNALYETQYKVNVTSPYGATGDGWYAAGEKATIAAPENPSSLLFLKKVFNGFAGYPDTGTTLTLPVEAPVTISATYRTELDLVLLTLSLAALAAVGGVYLATLYVQRRLQPKAEPEEAAVNR